MNQKTYKEFYLYFHLDDFNQLSDQNIDRLRNILENQFDTDTIYFSNFKTNTDLGLLVEKPFSINCLYKLIQQLKKENINYPVFSIFLDLNNKEEILPFNEKFLVIMLYNDGYSLSIKITTIMDFLRYEINQENLPAIVKFKKDNLTIEGQISK